MQAVQGIESAFFSVNSSVLASTSRPPQQNYSQQAIATLELTTFNLTPTLGTRLIWCVTIVRNQDIPRTSGTNYIDIHKEPLIKTQMQMPLIKMDT